jgi:NAD(P)-dependent dehydrogenase (short-subunit alcohol dehydrogenase family)
LATNTFEDGAAWFKEHPQQGNAYNFSKEVATVYTMSMALAFNQRGLRINAVLPGPVDTPILGFAAQHGDGGVGGIVPVWIERGGVWVEEAEPNEVHRPVWVVIRG